MSLLDRVLRRIQRTFVLGPGAPAPTREPVPPTPVPRHRNSTSRTVVTVAAAAVLPIAFGVLLITVRGEIGQSISLLMVLPVLVVALLAGRRLGTLAALAAAVAYDVLHTHPYYRATIDDPDDVIETVVLLAIGVSAGYLAESAQRAFVTSRVRREELAAVTRFLEHIGTSASGEELAGHAGASILSLLHADECVWRPGYRGTASPVLRSDGTFASTLIDDPSSGVGFLPRTIEIPVGQPPTERGRFVVRTNRRAGVSLEERRAAASVAAALARRVEA